MEEQFYRSLVERYLNKQLSDEELEVFYQLLLENKLDSYLQNAMDRDAELIQKSSTPVKKISGVPYSIIYKAAAVMLLPVLAFLGYQSFKSRSEQSVSTEIQSAQIQPATNRAVLTLSNGRQIALDSSAGTVLKEGDITIRKNVDGVIVYEGFESKENLSPDGVARYNTIQTPRGGVYQVILPDNSKVWLNNVSSIRFPVQFSRNERRVRITGEAYFEVVTDKRKPFRVESEGQEVEVLGTHFNVNAYNEEPVIKTTLFEGSVRVRAGKNIGMLKPGLQSIISADNNIQIASADMQSVISWKEGFFKFDKVDMQTFMRQIARWYDIEVEYKGDIPQDEFVGTIKRDANIGAVLKVLEYGKIKFQLKGRKLIIG